MNSHIRVAVAAWVVIGSLIGPSIIAAFQQDVALRYRWTKGETLRYRTIQHSATVMSGLPGGMGDITVDQTMTQVFRAVVQDIAADGTTTLLQSVESVRVDMTSPMGKSTYDSASADTSVNPANPMMTSMLSAMIGEPFTVVLLPTGAVQKVEGFSRLVEKMSTNIPQDRTGSALLSSLKGTFSDEAMLDMMAQGFTQLPDRPLKVGESWNSQITIRNPILGGLTTSIAATLKAVEGSAGDHVARIATQMTIKQDATAPAAANALGLSVQMGNSSGEGEILFDAARGRLLRSTTRMTTPMTMLRPGPDGTPMSMKSDVKSTVTVELIQQ